MVLCSFLATLSSLEVRMCAVQCVASQIFVQIECTLQSNALPLFRTRSCCHWCSRAVFFPTICNIWKAQQNKTQCCGLIVAFWLSHLLFTHPGLRFTQSLMGWLGTLALGWSSLPVRSGGCASAAVHHLFARPLLSDFSAALPSGLHCSNFILNVHTNTHSQTCTIQTTTRWIISSFWRPWRASSFTWPRPGGTGQDLGRGKGGENRRGKRSYLSENKVSLLLWF